MHNDTALPRHQLQPCVHRPCPYLPRNREGFVEILGVEETINVLLYRCLKLVFQNDVGPVGFLDIQPQTVVLLPEA